MPTTAKTLDATDARAIALIGVYAFYTGCFIFLGIATPILRLKAYNLNAELFGAIAIALIGWFLSKNLSKSLTKSCIDNRAISFSWQILVAIALFWLSLLLILSLDLAEVVTPGLMSAVWAIAAAALVGVAFRVASAIQIGKLKNKETAKKISIKGKSSFKPDLNQLMVIADNDGRVIISPQVLAQQPQQFRGLMCLILSLFVWTILELPTGVAELVAIALSSCGLTNLSTWQILLYPPERKISIQFSGIWGMASSFTINLAQFSRLETIKLKEIDLQWLQFAGISSVITLPIALTESVSKHHNSHLKYSEYSDQTVTAANSLGNSSCVSNSSVDGSRSSLIKPNLIQTLTDNLSLAEHKVSKDILSVMDIILPQSIGTLAGMVILGLGIALLILLPLPSKMPLETTILLTGICLVCPSLSRLILRSVAPSTMILDRSKLGLLAWEVGTGLILIAIFGSQFRFEAESLLALALIWLCCGVGCCILALSRRSPLITKRF